jgi:hypothetical protein
MPFIILVVAKASKVQFLYISSVVKSNPGVVNYITPSEKTCLAKKLIGVNIKATVL